MAVKSVQNSVVMQQIPEVENKQGNLYKVNFRANDDQFVRQGRQQGPVYTQPAILNQQDTFTKMLEEQEKEAKKQKRKSNLSWGVGIASGLAIIAMVIAQMKGMRGEIKTPGGFQLSNLKFINLSKDENIANIRTTKTLASKIQTFFVEMLDASGIDPKYIQRAGLKDKGFPNCGLLLGPSGTGKTESVKMFAKENNSELLIIKLGDFANSYVDGTATNMTKMFEQLNELFRKNPNKKYTILFDEADGIAKKLGNISADKDYLNKNRQSFLTGCDLIMPNKNVNVFAATNVSLKDMDEAVISRFGKNVEFNLPNENQLIEGLKFHLKDCEGLTDGKGFDFFTTKSEELKEFAEEMVTKKYAFRDLQKMTTDAQSLYAKDMNNAKQDLMFDVKYLREAMERKGKNAAEVADECII